MATRRKPPAAPADFAHPWSKPTAAWRKHLVTDYGLTDDPAAVVLLDRACACLDRLHEAERLLAEDGLIVNGPSGPKAHPAAAIAKDAQQGLLTALRMLRLDVDPNFPSVGRPPGVA